MHLKQTLHNWQDYLLHKPYAKFGIILVVVLIYLGYALVEFGVQDGLLVGLATWCFFVLCTPLADAGFILDLPLRLFLRIRMVYAEAAVWVIAALSTLVLAFNSPFIFAQTKLLGLFFHIISQPIPYWLIFILGAFGTFLSLMLTEEVIDIGLDRNSQGKLLHSHKHMWRLVMFVGFFLLVLAMYDLLLRRLGIVIF